MAVTIGSILNQWAEMGLFSLVLPWLLIFAVLYAILIKSKILGENRAVQVIVSASIGLLALQFNFVSHFFEIIFPKFGIGIAVLLIVMLFVGMFPTSPAGFQDKKWVILGVVIAIGVIWFSFLDANYITNITGNRAYWWIEEYFWSIVIGLGIVGAIWAIVKK